MLATTLEFKVLKKESRKKWNSSSRAFMVKSGKLNSHIQDEAEYPVQPLPIASFADTIISHLYCYHGLCSAQ